MRICLQRVSVLPQTSEKPGDDISIDFGSSTDPFKVRFARRIDAVRLYRIRDWRSARREPSEISRLLWIPLLSRYIRLVDHSHDLEKVADRHTGQRDPQVGPSHRKDPQHR